VFRFESSDLIRSAAWSSAEDSAVRARRARPTRRVETSACRICSSAGRIGARASRRRMSSRLCMPCDRSIADEIRGAKPVAIHIFFLVILSSFKLWRGSERDMHAPALCNPRRVPSTQGGRIVGSTPPAIHLHVAEKTRGGRGRNHPRPPRGASCPSFGVVGPEAGGPSG